MRQLYAYVANESTRRLVEDGMNTGLTNKQTAPGFSVQYHVFARQQCILCSALRHKSYLTLPYVTSRRDSFCLGTTVGSQRGTKTNLVSRVSLLYTLWSLDRGDGKKRYPGCEVGIKLGSRPAPSQFGHVVSGFLVKTAVACITGVIFSRFSCVISHFTPRLTLGAKTI